jgi:YHS domain-containing protein
VRALFWIVRALGVLLILRLVLRMLFPVRPDGARPANRSSQPIPTERAGGELVRDPNCGTYIPKSRAIAVARGGNTLYFCSTTCRDAYGHSS